jgi:SAM-dependent MidA family methyltransferase
LGVERWALNPSNGNTVLIDLIRAEIQKHGPQSFAWFMQQALYHPEHGYYSSGRASIGRKGDYFTNVSVGPLFGQLMAAQFAEIWEQLGNIDNFVIVEQGAHDGQFARDVLDSAQDRSPEFFAALRYRIVEPFPILEDRQREALRSFGDKVEWHRLITPFIGIHFSNELLDAMPVRLIGSAGEKCVDLDGDKLVFVERPVGDAGKFNQAALDWIENVAAKLERGYVVAIDYGYSRDEFRETVQVRAHHRHLDSPFEQIGHADITAHVNWTDIVERAEVNGLHLGGFTDQHHFLTGIISTWPGLVQPHLLDLTALSSQVPVAGADEKSRRALQTLLHPEMLGRSFQVLALGKDVDPSAQLAGFKFARTPNL